MAWGRRCNVIIVKFDGPRPYLGASRYGLGPSNFTKITLQRRPQTILNGPRPFQCIKDEAAHHMNKTEEKINRVIQNLHQHHLDSKKIVLDSGCEIDVYVLVWGKFSGALTPRKGFMSSLWSDVFYNQCRPASF